MPDPAPTALRSDGLTNAEGVVMDHLCAAVNAFAQVERQHPDELRDFVDDIHKCQDQLAVRVCRRAFPIGWPIKVAAAAVSAAGRSPAARDPLPVGGAQRPDPPATSPATRDLVLAHLANGAATRTEIADAVGRTKAGVARAVKRLLAEGKVVDTGERRVGPNGGRIATVYAARTQLDEAAPAPAPPAPVPAPPAPKQAAKVPPPPAPPEDDEIPPEDAPSPAAMTQAAANLQADAERRARLRDQVRQHLAEHGPKTPRQVALELTRNTLDVAVAISDLERHGKVVRAGVRGYNAVDEPAEDVA
jgi:hypothetical protein